MSHDHDDGSDPVSHEFPDNLIVLRFVSDDRDDGRGHDRFGILLISICHMLLAASVGNIPDNAVHQILSQENVVLVPIHDGIGPDRLGLLGR